MTTSIERPVGTDRRIAPPSSRHPSGRLRALLELGRPGQWPKNFLVVPIALIGAPDAGTGALTGTAWAVLLFTMASVLVYVCNDIADRHRDRLHPVKRHRPVASGRISVSTATGFGAALAVLLAVAALTGPVDQWWPVAVYLAMNAAYSLGLKHVPLVDVFVVAAGFVLRVVLGCLAVGAPVRSWLLVSVFALCLVFVLGKRRHEVAVSGAGHRPALRGYSTQYLDHLILLCAGLTVTAFLFEIQQMVAAPYTELATLGSVPFAFFAIARYLQLLQVDRGGGEPTKILLRDRPMVINSLLWGALLAGTLLAARP